MTTKNIVEKAAEILGVTVNTTTPDAVTEQVRSCADYIVRELTEQYLELTDTVTVTTSDGKIHYSVFPKSAVKAVRVRKDGKWVRFREYPTYLQVAKQGKYTVEYIYRQDCAAYTTELVFPPRLSTDILALGTVGEYYLRTGFTDRAQFYSERYLTALKNGDSVKKTVLLPSRRLI